MKAHDVGGAAGNGDRPTFWCGQSLFNTGGQRLNEIDFENRHRPQTHAEMTDEDWEDAKAALLTFEHERGIR